MAHDVKSLDRAIAKQVWGLRDPEAAALDAKAGRLPPERYADLPYRGGGPVAPGDFRRVFTAGYWVGWRMSLPTWSNPYRPETPYGQTWLDGYGEGRRVALAQVGPQKAVGGG